MVTTKPLDMRKIFKRNRMIGKNINRFNSKLNESLLEQASKANTSSKKKSLYENYVTTCSSYMEIIPVLENCYKESNYTTLEQFSQYIIENVIPTIKDLNGFIDNIKNRNIGEPTIDKLVECAKMYKSIDRIRLNNTKLQKRFDLSKVYNKHKSIIESCFDICNMTDTYSLSPFIKMNIALEELTYLGFMNGVNITESSIVEPVLEYFLLRENNTMVDIYDYNRAIKESKVLSKPDGLYFNSDTFRYMEELDKEDKLGLNAYKIMSYNDILNKWKMRPKKNIDTLNSVVREFSNNSKAIYEAMKLMADYNRVNDTDHNLFVTINEFNDPECYELCDIESLIEALENIIKYPIISENDYKVYTETLDTMKNDIYTAFKNGEVLDEVDPKDDITFTSNKIDKFKMHNLIVDAQETGEFLDKMSKNECHLTQRLGYDDSKAINESNFRDYIDEDSHISVLVRSYNFKDIDPYTLRENAESVCKCISNILYEKTSEPYVTIGENTIDYYLRTKYEVILSLKEESGIGIGFPDSVKRDFIKEAEYLDIMESIYYKPINFICDKLHDREYAANISTNEFRLLDEMTYSIGYDIDDFVNLIESEANMWTDEIKGIHSSSKDFFIEDNRLYAEVYDNIDNVLSINEEFNLNTVKLAWQGFKTKAKKLGAKEQEICRDADAAFNHLLKGLKSTFTTDHREQIIRGQVTPSLSKMLKMGIALAGLGVVTGSPFIPALTAVAGYAMSKRASHKEKAMILDEIDIELKVVERELSRAESSGSSKKYRALLTIQKNLQREKQRIHYGLQRSGKSIPVSSTAGIGGKD